MDSQDKKIDGKLDEQPDMKSGGQPSGFLDKVRGGSPAILSNEAPRVVAVLKILGCSAMCLSKNGCFAVAGAGFIIAHSIMGLFAGKKSEEEKERLRKKEEAKQSEPKTAVGRHLHKVVNPKQYPIESAATIATGSSLLWTAAGIFGKDGFSPARFIGGLLSLGSDANVAFKKEHIGEAGANPHNKGSVDYYVTEMKNRPVLFSSMLNIGCDIATIVGGAHEKYHGKEINTLLAGLFLLSANVFQAIFVNKNDYNIERKTGLPEKSIEAQVAKPLLENKKEIAWQDRVEQQAIQPQEAVLLHR